jgi:PAS domain S-box-containing protein
MTSTRQRAGAFWLLTVAATAAVFVVDVLAPPGLAIPMIYVLPLLATWVLPSRRSTLAVAASALALTVVKPLFWLDRLTAVSAAERVLTVILLSLVAALVSHAKRLRDLGLLRDSQLSQSEQRFSVIHDRAPFAIALTGLPDGRTVSVNDAFLRIFECTREEAIGKTIVELGLSTPGLQTLVAKELGAHGAVRDLEVVRTSPSGSRRVLVLNIDKVRIGDRDFVLATGADVTNLKLAEERWRASETRLRIALDAASAGVWSWEPGSDRIECDDRCRELLGIPPGAAVTRERWLACLAEDDRRRFAARIERLLAAGGGDAISEEFRVPRPGGGFAWVGTFGQVERDRSGRAVRLLGINLDISSRKLVEQQLRDDRDELERRVQERTEELRRVATELTLADRRARESIARTLHDGLQQLVFGTRLQVERLLRDRGESVDPARDDLERIVANLDEALEATRTLSVDLFPPVLREAGLRDALEWLAGWMRAHHGLEVTLSLDPAADTDGRDARVLVFESVRELLFNVVKHAGVREASVDTATADHGSFRVTVADAGVGLDVAAVDERARWQGTGTGLASIRERLSLVGGRMEIDGAPGNGCRVTLIVPRRAGGARRQQPRLRAADAPPAGRGQPAAGPPAEER